MYFFIYLQIAADEYTGHWTLNNTNPVKNADEKLLCTIAATQDGVNDRVGFGFSWNLW